MRCKKRCTFTNLFVMSVLLVLVISLVIPVNTRGDENGDETDNYIVRDPIRINGNSDFAAQAAAEGWPGDGNEDNPYIIEGYEIEGTGHGCGIYVGNTTVHFVVRRCYVHNVTGKNGTREQNSGLYLKNVRNGQFENNHIIFNHWGLKLRYSDKNTIHNNTIVTTGYGIEIWHSEHNIITNNTIYYKGTDLGREGISTLISDYHTIKNNNISNFKWGILLEFNTMNYEFEIENNTYNNNQEDLFVAYMSADNGYDDSLFISFAFIVIAVLVAALVIWKKKR